MKNVKLKDVPRARSGPPTPGMVRTITAGLTRAAEFISSFKKEMLSSPTVDMSREIQVAAYTVITRMVNICEQRRKLIRARIDEQLAELEPLLPGEKERRIQSGPFVIVWANKYFNRKVIDPDALRDLLKRKRISQESVTVTPEAPPPFFSEELVALLVQEGKISSAEHEAVLVPAEPLPEVRVEVPDQLDNIISARLLGGLRAG